MGLRPVAGSLNDLKNRSEHNFIIISRDFSSKTSDLASWLILVVTLPPSSFIKG